MGTVLLPHLRPETTVRTIAGSVARTCRLCGCNTSITRHHLIPKWDAGRAAWRSHTHNVITICRSCHDRVDAHDAWISRLYRHALRAKLHDVEVNFIVKHRGVAWLEEMYPP